MKKNDSRTMAIRQVSGIPNRSNKRQEESTVHGKEKSHWHRLSKSEKYSSIINEKDCFEDNETKSWECCQQIIILEESSRLV